MMHTRSDLLLIILVSLIGLASSCTSDEPEFKPIIDTYPSKGTVMFADHIYECGIQALHNTLVSDKFGIFLDSFGRDNIKDGRINISNLEYDEGMQTLNKYRFGQSPSDDRATCFYFIQDGDLTLGLYENVESQESTVTIHQLDTMLNSITFDFDIKLVLRDVPSHGGWPDTLHISGNNLTTAFR